VTEIAYLLEVPVAKGRARALDLARELGLPRAAAEGMAPAAYEGFALGALSRRDLVALLRARARLIGRGG
jgi:hypothetical protein